MTKDRTVSRKRPGYDKEYYLLHREEHNAYSKRYAAEHREQIAAKKREYAAAHVEENRERRAEQAHLYATRHPEKVKARSAILTAKNYKGLVPQPCEMCGSTERIHAHHAFGYDQPLAVWWLCNSHHQAMHNAMRTAGSLA